MHTVIQMLPTELHVNSSRETFTLTLQKRQLTDAHNYWLYYVQVEHKSWRKIVFSIFVTKQAFPSEQMSDQLAKTLGVDEVKRLLEETTEEGRPLCHPQFQEGWLVH